MANLVNVSVGGQGISVKAASGQGVPVKVTGADGSVHISPGSAVIIGKSPYINDETNTWFEYDDKTGKYVDTGVLAGGDIFTEVSDEFYITDENVLYINQVPMEKVSGLTEEISDHVNNTTVHITSEERVLWNKRTYVHEQARVSDVWEVTHDLDKHPSVTVVDSAGTVVVGDVQYIDNSNIIITFNGAFSGTAYLN